ncbi:MAG: hypothetical protein JSW18_03915 [Candidatus Omnitrophota bacterium]|nr:MAG: hypothetical protein JSW18_03915 [Candidatus Omnitrophota bacterium]
MQVIKKLFRVGLIFTFLLSSTPFSYGAEVATNFFQPCQHKQVYQYYIEKAEDYLVNDQPEAALEAYKKALMVQPISKEAKQRIEYIKKMLKKRQRSKMAREREEAISVALERVEKRRFRKPLARRPVRRRPIKELRERLKEKLELARKPKMVKRPERVEKVPEIEKPAKAEKAPPEYVREKPRHVERRRRIEKPKRIAKEVPPEHVRHEVSGMERMKSFYREYLDPAEFSNGIDKSIQQGTQEINSGIAPGKISGEYRTALGFTSDDVIWKDANADHVGVPGEKNWRYLFGERMYNMYDRKIYSRLRVEAEGPVTQNLSAYSEIVVDPWTFVGRKDVTVTGSSGANVDMTLKYWSNARRILNETYRADNGDIVNLSESKVIDGKTSEEAYLGLNDWGPATYTVPETTIDRMYVPIRKLWVDYDNGPYHIRLFPMANQDEALTSDDPLRLSNNKAWWEESPWLDEYEPSRVFTRTGNPVKQGQWIRRLSSVAKDSDYERLTFLRGISASANYDNALSIESTFAAPRNLWDYYDEVSSVPGAVRVKLPAMGDTKLAGIYTTKLGIYKQDIEALNQVIGADGQYLYSPDTSIYGECAFSFTNIEEANDYDRDYWGAGYTIGFKNKGNLRPFGDHYELNLSLAHMNDNFLPGLSNYRMTRKDSIYAKHIYFDDLKPENEAEMLGNGIDIDRIAVNVNAKVIFPMLLPNNDLITRLDWRDVRSDSGNFIEDVTRVEAEYKWTPKLTAKGMVRYKHLPETEEGIDPLINAKTSYIAFTDYFSDKDVWLKNDIIEEGKDPSIGTFSLGLKYDALKNLSLQAIYEVTNDPLDMPRGLLNNGWVTQETRDGVLCDKIVPFLYSQSSFDQPPYSYYNIYKLRLACHPIDALKIEPSYVYNENRFATTIDDNVNHTGINFEYKPDNKLTLGLSYYYTMIRDLYRDTIGGEGENFDGHHNVFLAADYALNPNQTFSIMFGEYTGYGKEYYEEYTSIGPLDTQHIVRLIYKGKF